MVRKKQIAEFVRMPKTVLMPIADLKFDETASRDEQFIQTYKKYQSGRLVDIRTRVDIETIIPGFFRLTEQGDYEHVNKYAERALDGEIWRIRLGFRPTVFLYKTFVGPEKNKLICSDDLLAYHAYKNLGIRYIPAVILGRHPEFLHESGICTRGDPKSETIRFDSLIVHKHALVPSLAGGPDDINKRDLTEVLQILLGAVQSTKQAVSAFHRSSSQETIHYHHTLHSVLCSLEQTLRAVELLLTNRLEHQIRPLVRSAYDLFLNFYIDWLYPEKMGALLQALAVLSRIGKSHPGYNDLDKSVRETFGALAEILMNQTEKGRISPLGEQLHRAIYSELSPAVHQDFGVTQEFGDSLETGAIEPLPRGEIVRALQFLNVVVSATILRIADDVGLRLGTST